MHRLLEYIYIQSEREKADKLMGWSRPAHAGCWVGCDWQWMTNGMANRLWRNKISFYWQRSQIALFPLMALSFVLSDNCARLGVCFWPRSHQSPTFAFSLCETRTLEWNTLIRLFWGARRTMPTAKSKQTLFICLLPSSDFNSLLFWKWRFVKFCVFTYWQIVSQSVWLLNRKAIYFGKHFLLLQPLCP